MQRVGQVCWGKAAEDRDHKQWLVGSFMPTDSLLNERNAKIKFGTHQKGEGRSKDKASSDPNHWTMSFVLSGKQRLVFIQDGVEQEVVLVGDKDSPPFVKWAPAVLHYWEALEDNTVVLTICALVEPTKVP